MRQDTYCPVVASEAASAGDEVTNDMSLEESFPELRVQTGLHVRDRKARAATDRATRKKMHGNKNKREKARRLYTDPYM